MKLRGPEKIYQSLDDMIDIIKDDNELNIYLMENIDTYHYNLLKEYGLFFCLCNYDEIGADPIKKMLDSGFKLNTLEYFKCDGWANLSILNMLIDNGFDMKKHYDEIMERACSLLKIDTVNFLLNEGVEPNFNFVFYNNFCENITLLNFLYENGLDLNKTFKHMDKDTTLLSESIIYRNYELAKWLIDNGASYDNSHMKFAIARHAYLIIDLLASLGVSLKDDNNEYILHFINGKGFLNVSRVSNILRMLIDAGNVVNPCVFTRASFNHWHGYEIINFFLDNGYVPTIEGIKNMFSGIYGEINNISYDEILNHVSKETGNKILLSPVKFNDLIIRLNNHDKYILSGDHLSNIFSINESVLYTHNISKVAKWLLAKKLIDLKINIDIESIISVLINDENILAYKVLQEHYNFENDQYSQLETAIRSGQICFIDYFLGKTINHKKYIKKTEEIYFLLNKYKDQHDIIQRLAIEYERIYNLLLEYE